MAILSTAADPYQACIYACSRCAQACYECLNACLNEQDANPRKNCIKMLMECAKMCEMSVGLMAMNGQFAKDHCKLCATICDKCAQECKMVQDEHCQKCAQECTTCAEECNRMSGM
ncbi:four-helix bundle copper-binding protein [Clostridium sporogenes]|uniref:Four-helix bundle copper-binding protein n=1 Tax=Clostridium sporogenes TaxID=1509 RepID=A0AAE4FKN5_CLOSG|nr:four-helix bundle copper-binding protein [Clostridium sporogenes]MDS1003065.1 four-helix bundle copper-binding protein [Clostridium sporogenes]